MTSQSRVLFVAGDPGGAAALLPVITTWTGPKTVLVYRQAAKIYRDAGLEIQELGEGAPSLQAAAEWIKSTQAAMVVGATSVNGIDWECYFFQAAAGCSVPSLAVLDYWSNYSPRFTLAQPLDALPDLIAVMDERARQEMLAAGFPGDRLRITGQPVLDEARRWRAGIRKDHRQQFREQLQLPPEATAFLYVSQPLREMRATTGTVTTDEDEFAALIRLSQAMQELADPRMVLLIKLHPREPSDKYDAILGELPFQARIVNPALHRWEVCLAADQVWSISSMLLEEARAMGCRVGMLRTGEPVHLLPSGHADEPDARMEMPLATALIRQLIDQLLASPAPASDGQPDSQ